MERDTDGMKTSALVSLERKLKVYTCLRRMFKVTMILLLLTLVLIYSEIGYSFHEKQITKTAQLPHRFFPSHSGVIDYQYGDLQPVIKLLQDEELIFVMYYAPWCAKSMHVRSEFIRAARVLSDTIKFVGVNCWYFDGECRQRMKFLSYPELFMYVTGVQIGYRFTGVKEAEYFVKFAESFMFPLKPLHSQQELEEFQAQQENTVIGYFDFHSSPQPPGPKFHQFYLSSLRTMSYDFHQPVRFGIVHSRFLAKYLDMLGSESTFVLFRAGNSTLKYPFNHNFTCSNITNWIYSNKVKSFSPWLVPPGVKSLTMSLPMQKGPAVLVFAPVNPLVDFNPYLDMVRMASYEYSHCGNQADLHSGSIQTLVISSLLNLFNARKLQKQSLDSGKTVLKKIRDLSSKDVPSECCMSLTYGCCTERQNCVCEYCIHRENKHRSAGCSIDVNKGLLEDLHIHSCSDFSQFYNVNEHHSLCCKQKNLITPTNLFPQDSAKRTRRVTDSYIANAENYYFKRQMRKMTLQKVKKLITVEDLSKHLTTISDIRSVNFTGLQCRTNRSVNFYFVDSVYHSLFVEHLGLPTAVEPKQPSVILVDLKAESQYILREQLTYKNLATFILNYTSNQLVQHRRSEEVFSPSQCDDRNVICLSEVTTDTFQSIVMDTNKDVLLLYYTPWCGFCSEFSQMFLTVAQYFSDMKNITFARINADSNDLPWHYTVDSYPTLLFFPANRKSESVAFPQNVPKTMPNLIKFISYHANQTVLLNTAINMCSSECKNKNVRKVIKRIAELETEEARLERRGVTLWSQYSSDEEHRKLLRMEGMVVKKAQKTLRNKLTMAHMLSYFLKEEDWKKLDREMLLNFLKTID